MSAPPPADDDRVMEAWLSLLAPDPQSRAARLSRRGRTCSPEPELEGG